MQHWQYNVIVTKTAGAIKYSVSDSVEEKGTIVNRRNCWYKSSQCVKSLQ